MATYLQLCQRLASESGTVNGTFPTAVAGQTGRLEKIVRWVNDAWRDIQNAHATWRWMQGEWSGSTVAGQQRYAPVTDFSLTRFGEWDSRRDGTEDRFTIYDPAIGVADEGPLIFLEWDRFYTRCVIGSHAQDRPVYFSIAPDNKLALGPVPDKVYTVRGPYRKSPQDLTADADTPELPARFHTLIATAALEYLGTNDEAAFQLQLWQLRRIRGFSDLERDQLPMLRLNTGPLA